MVRAQKTLPPYNAYSAIVSLDELCAILGR
jgi:hypothetical protein